MNDTTPTAFPLPARAAVISHVAKGRPPVDLPPLLDAFDAECTATALRSFLWRLEQSAGDSTAEKLLDDNPDLAALLAGAGAAVPVPAADRATLRDRIAAAMREHYLCTNRDEADADGNMPCRCGDWREPGPMGSDEDDWDSHLAEAVLAALPSPLGIGVPTPEQRANIRSHAYTEAADWFDTEAAECLGIDERAAQKASRELRRLAAEAAAGRVAAEPAALPEALEAALTKRYTELGNQFAEMRVHEQGPDGWPSSRHVSPRMVADVLRELLGPAAPAQPGKEAKADPDCERCEGSGLDPDAYFVDRDSQTWTHAPCSECLPEDDDSPEPTTERVKHSGPDTKFCVLCLSGEHERVDSEQPGKEA